MGKPMYAGGARRNANLSLFEASVVCPILTETETARKFPVKCPDINFRFVLALYAHRQTEGQMDERKDDGILIDAPRRCDHTQT